MDFNNTLKNTVSVTNFEREMKNFNSELTQAIDHNNVFFKTQINNLSENKLEKAEFKNIIQDYANIEKLEKFIHIVHEMRKIIEKNIEVKFKDDINKIQIDINQKLDQTDLNNHLNN